MGTPPRRPISTSGVPVRVPQRRAASPPDARAGTGAGRTPRRRGGRSARGRAARPAAARMRVTSARSGQEGEVGARPGQPALQRRGPASPSRRGTGAPLRPSTARREAAMLQRPAAFTAATVSSASVLKRRARRGSTAEIYPGQPTASTGAAPLSRGAAVGRSEWAGPTAERGGAAKRRRHARGVSGGVREHPPRWGVSAPP